jgi:hypothetical protein
MAASVIGKALPVLFLVVAAAPKSPAPPVAAPRTGNLFPFDKDYGTNMAIKSS